eukprot:UN03501
MEIIEDMIFDYLTLSVAKNSQNHSSLKFRQNGTLF